MCVFLAADSAMATLSVTCLLYCVICIQEGDAAAALPPALSWHIPLNSHASRLKEFSVTVREAMKLVRVLFSQLMLAQQQ